MKLFIVALVLTVYFVCLNAEEIQVDENLEGLEYFEPTKTIPTHSSKSVSASGLLSILLGKLSCTGKGTCPGTQTCCWAFGHSSCCPKPHVRFS